MCPSSVTFPSVHPTELQNAESVSHIVLISFDLSTIYGTGENVSVTACGLNSMSTINAHIKINFAYFYHISKVTNATGTCPPPLGL